MNITHCLRCGLPFKSEAGQFGPMGDERCFACHLQLCVWEQEITALADRGVCHEIDIMNAKNKLLTYPKRVAKKSLQDEKDNLWHKLDRAQAAIDNIKARIHQLQGLCENFRPKEAAA